MLFVPTVLCYVYTFYLQVPHWIRGEESAQMLEPRPHKLPMLGLGYSVGTGAGGITAEAVVVKTFDELDKKASDVSICLAPNTHSMHFALSREITLCGYIIFCV